MLGKVIRCDEPRAKPEACRALCKGAIDLHGMAGMVAPYEVTNMKINIDELSYDEIREVVDQLRRMKIEAKVARLGSSVILQTEQGPLQVPQNEAVELFGIPAVF